MDLPTPNPLGLTLLGPLLFELNQELATTAGEPQVVRHAVRAVICNDDELLMVHSTRGGDYKFPGGGIEPNEHPIEALAREISEECATVAAVGDPIGSVIEYHHDRAGGLFVMASHYFHARAIGPAQSGQQLDEYEAARGFTPAWVSPAHAASANREVLNAGAYDRWVPRETRMLELLG